MKKKILYTFYHGAAFPWALVHRMTVHPQDDAYLLVADGWDWCAGKPKLLLLLRFVDMGVFRKVYHYDNRLGRESQFDTLEKTEEKILIQTDADLLAQGCNITEFDEIYSNTDGEDTIGIYFSLKKIKFYWYEFGKNLLNIRSEQWIRENYAELKGYQAALLKHKTLFGGSELQTYVLYPESCIGVFPKERSIVFDVEKAAEALSEIEKKRILKGFGLESISCPENGAMLLLQSNWLPQQVFSSNEFVQKRFKDHWLYMFFAIQCMMDYFLPENATPILKTHPTVVIDEKTSRRYFGGAFAFPALFTVLLTKSLLKEYIPKYRILLGSSANAALSKSKNDIYCPGVWLFSVFYTKYVVALRILSQLQEVYAGVGERFEPIGNAGVVMNYNGDYLKTDINSLVEVHYPAAEKKARSRYLVMQLYQKEHLLKQLLCNDFILVTDVWQTIGKEDLEELSKIAYVTTIEIEKKPLKNSEDILAPMETEYVYLISKQPVWSERLGNAEEGVILRRKNRASGVEVFARILETSQYVTKTFALRQPFRLFEYYCEAGRIYKDEWENEIRIDGEITERAIENMKAITLSFSGGGKNKVLFRDLNSLQKFSGNFRVEALSGSRIEIGKLLFANSNVLIHAAHSEIFIGNDVMMESNVTIKAMNYHSVYQCDGTRLQNKNVEIGEHVWIGYGATIFAGSVIGVGSVINAGSVVAGQIPNNVVSEGNPAKVVRKNIFWNWYGTEKDYYDLPKEQQIADDYIAETGEVP